MPDTNFIAAFANNPITLTILMITVIIVIAIWKIGPYAKDIIEHIDNGNSALDSKVTDLLLSDGKQTQQITEIGEHVRLNTLDVLRITVYNEGVDPEDRLVAAKRYFIRGGNGKVAEYVKTLIAQYPHSWKTILAMVSAEERQKLVDIVGDGDDQS